MTKKLLTFTASVLICVFCMACAYQAQGNSQALPTPSQNDTAQETIEESIESVGDETTEPNDSEAESELRVRLVFEGGEAIVSLADNVAARGWYEQLPLTLPLENFRSWHKICRIPENISTEGMTVGNNPEIGDIFLHIPWNTLVFYYDEYDGNNSSVHMGHVESGLDLIAAMENGSYLLGFLQVS